MSRVIYTKEKTKRKKKQPGTKPVIRCSFCHEERHLNRATTLVALEKAYKEKFAWPSDLRHVDGWVVQAALKRRLIWACDVCLSSGRTISAQPWLQVPSLANPEFAYADQALECLDCGKAFTFSAHEQQYWYEQLRFVRGSQPKQCVACRRKRRIYKRHFHDLQRALESLDPHNVEHLVRVADSYLRIGHTPKALEFLRRAKTKARSSGTKAELQQRITSLQDEQEEHPEGRASP